MRLWLVVCVLTATIMVSCGSAPSTREVSSLGVGSTRLTAMNVARRVHDKVNELRAEHGLKALRWEPRLLDIATAHSRDMMARGYFAHQSPDGHNFQFRYKAGGYKCEVPIDRRRYSTGGENLALSHSFDGVRTFHDGRRESYGPRTPDQVAQRVLTGWFNSPGHRRNLLRPYWRQEVIGVVIGADGRIWVTQNFC